MNAYDRGRSAFHEGCSIRANPYAPKTFAWQWWLDGWDDAMNDAEIDELDNYIETLDCPHR